MTQKLDQQIVSSLIVMADKFDAEGDFTMAAKVDSTIRSMARGRPKSPLKNLDDDVKESLVKFLHNISKRMEASKSDLEELFRRMRYFDVADSAKGLGLEKALKDMDKVQQCVDSGKESLHGMLGGNKSELKALIDKLDDGGDAADDDLDPVEHNPLDFFAEQSAKDEKSEEDIKEELDSDEPDQDEISEEDLEELDAFWDDWNDETFEGDE